MQFKGAFRKLLVRCGVKPNTRGNAIPLDAAMCLVQAEKPTSCIEQSSVSEDGDIGSTFEEMEFSVDMITSLKFNSLVENVLVYISGFVVRKVFQRLRCDACCCSLVTDTYPASERALNSYHLLQLKNRGGLVVPSEEVVRVVEEAERCIRAASVGKPPHFKCSVKLLDLHVRRVIGSRDINSSV